jgi:hypothetical protein
LIVGESFVHGVIPLSGIGMLPSLHFPTVMVGVALILSTPCMVGVEGVDPSGGVGLGLTRLSLGDVFYTTSTMSSLGRAVGFLLRA